MAGSRNDSTLVGRRRTDVEIPRTGRLAGRASLDELLAEVESRAARSEPIHGAMRIHEYTLKELAKHFGLDDSAISTIAKQVDQA
jgi:hypothetical protein